MSIEQTIAGLTRANAIVQTRRLTEAVKIAPVGRGDFCLIEREHRYTSLPHGASGWVRSDCGCRYMAPTPPPPSPPLSCIFSGE
jgi:hypothetical protein